MTFLAPGWIALAAVTSLAVAVIHLIAWRQPRAVKLPTARFVPDEPARRAARTIRPADLALLALRVSILMAGGVAMARPTLSPSPEGEATVVAIERSAAIADTAALRDNIRDALPAGRTAFVVFDTTATILENQDAAMADVLRAGAGDRTSLTVGLVAAIREARRLTSDYESVEIVLASTFSRASFDRATQGVRGTWPDSIRVVRQPRAAEELIPVSVEITGSGDDPVAAGIRLAQSNGLLRGASRIVRHAVSASDRAWVDTGRVLVIWPRAEANITDRVDGIHAGGFTAIGHFRRQPLGDSGRVMARWLDGAPAATESKLGSGCVRTIGFDMADVGDFVLTPAFQRLASVLTAPCGGNRAQGAAADSIIAALIAPSTLTPASAMPDESRRPNRLAAMLMVLAIIFALGELVLRRRGTALISRAVEQGA